MTIIVFMAECTLQKCNIYRLDQRQQTTAVWMSAPIKPSLHVIIIQDSDSHFSVQLWWLSQTETSVLK